MSGFSKRKLDLPDGHLTGRPGRAEAMRKFGREAYNGAVPFFPKCCGWIDDGHGAGA